MAIFSASFILLLLAAMPFSSQSPTDYATALADSHSPAPRTSSKSRHHTPTTTSVAPPQTSASTSTSTTPTFPGVPYITETSKSGRTIYVKTGVNGCNMEGTASTYLNSVIYNYSPGPLADLLVCQGYCRFTSQCQSYSFDISSSNCTFYRGNVVGEVTAQTGTGIFFSNKYPADGSDYCYDNVPLPPASSSWLYPYPQRRALATGMLDI